MDRLAKRSYCVFELAPLLHLDVSTVSKHLGILKASGILQSKKAGTTVSYSLEARFLLPFIDCLEKRLFCQTGRNLPGRSRVKTHHAVPGGRKA